MKRIIAVSFVIIAFASCEKATERTIRCWTCTQPVFEDRGNGINIEGVKSHDVCNLNDADIKNYEIRHSNKRHLDSTFGTLTCVAKDSI